jgi:hypothetical protein
VDGSNNRLFVGSILVRLKGLTNPRKPSFTAVDGEVDIRVHLEYESVACNLSRIFLWKFSIDDWLIEFGEL